MKTPLRIYFILVASLLGAMFGLYLASHYFEIHSGIAGFKSLCNFGNRMDCNVVAASPYAALLGIPVGGLGAGWFLAALLLAASAINRFWRAEALRLLTLWSSLGVAVSLVYLYFMLGRIGTLCVYCLGMDVLIALILGLTLSMKPVFRGHKPQWKQVRLLAGASLGVTAIVALATLGFNRYSMDAEEIAPRVNAILTGPQNPVRSGPEFPSIGPENAPVTIVEFSDFQCPYCRIGAFILHTVQMQFPQDVRIVFRNFPLDPRCNPQVKHSMHAVACQSAQVSLCAHLSGKFSATYEALFEDQAQLTSRGPTRIAESHGINIPELERCMQSPEVATRLRMDIEEATRLNVQSTPTFFINGYRVEGAFPAPVWKSLIRELLNRREKKPETPGYAAR